MRARAILAGLGSLAVAGATAAQDAGSGAPEANADLQKELQNPIATVVSVPFQENFGFQTGPRRQEQSDLIVYPVVPIPLKPQWNYIVRPVMPPVPCRAP